MIFILHWMSKIMDAEGKKATGQSRNWDRI